MRMIGLIASVAALSCSNGTPTPTPDASFDANGDTAADAVGDGNPCPAAAATISGTFLGATLKPKDAISLFTQTSQYEVVVAVTDYANRCPYGNDGQSSSNVLAIVYESSQPLSPVTFDLAQTKVVFAEYTQWDGTRVGERGHRHVRHGRRMRRHRKVRSHVQQRSRDGDVLGADLQQRARWRRVVV